MDWKTTKNKDADSLKKLIESRYGVKATKNSSGGVTATVNGQSYDWSIDKDGNPRRVTAPKTLKKGDKLTISLGKEENKSISPQKNVFTLDKAKSLANKPNVQVLQQMQQNPKNANTIAQNSFSTGAGTTNTGAIQPTQQTSNWSLFPQANAGYVTDTTPAQSKTDRQNAEYNQKMLKNAQDNIQNFLYDSYGTKDKKMEELRNNVIQALDDGVDEVEISNGLDYAGYKSGNWAQKKLDWLGGGLNKIGDAITIQSDEDDGFFTSLGKGILNIPGSALGLVGDTVETVSHPWETAKGIGELADTGGDYLNYLVTGDPLMDKSKATGEALYNLATDKATYVENPADIVSLALGGYGALTKTGKVGSVSKVGKVGNTGKGVMNTVKNLGKKGVDYAYNPEKIPGDVVKAFLPKNKSEAELKTKQKEVVFDILQDKKIDSKDKKPTLEDVGIKFTDIFNNEKVDAKKTFDELKNKAEYDKNVNKSVETLKKYGDELEITKDTKYADIANQLHLMEDKRLLEEIAIADTTPRWTIKQFDRVDEAGNPENKMREVITQIRDYAITKNSDPKYAKVAKLANDMLVNEDKVKLSDKQMLQIKRLYNKEFNNVNFKNDGTHKDGKLGEIARTAENNTKFLDNNIKVNNSSDEIGKKIKQFDTEISEIKNLRTIIEKNAEKVRGKQSGVWSTGVANVIDALDKIANYSAKVSQIIKSLGLKDKLTIQQAEKLIYSNMNKLKKIQKEIDNGNLRKQALNKFEEVMRNLAPVLTDNVINSKALKTSGKVLKKGVEYRKGIGIPKDVMDEIEEEKYKE